MCPAPLWSDLCPGSHAAGTPGWAATPHPATPRRCRCPGQHGRRGDKRNRSQGERNGGCYWNVPCSVGTITFPNKRSPLLSAQQAARAGKAGWLCLRPGCLTPGDTGRLDICSWGWRGRGAGKPGEHRVASESGGAPGESPQLSGGLAGWGLAPSQCGQCTGRRGSWHHTGSQPLKRARGLPQMRSEAATHRVLC